MIEKIDKITLKDLAAVRQFINYKVINRFININTSVLEGSFNNFSFMRKRFEQQLQLGQLSISEIKVNPKYRSGFPKLVLALKELFLAPEHNEQIFCPLEDHIQKGKKNTGRTGMDLWILFVLAQTRLCLKV